MSDFDLVIRGGSVVDGSGAEPMLADVGIVGARIDAVGELSGRRGAEEIDAVGQLVFPGFIDAHSHADALLATPRVQEAYLRQGVTSVILGQDGVSFAPTTTSSAAYPARYFAAVNGATPEGLEGGASVAEFLHSVDRSGAINAGYLVPAGVVRDSVVGGDARAATSEEIERMRELVARAMADGALGLSTGLDYVPGGFASTDELAAICEPVGRAHGVYVSHLRGYGSDTVASALGELARIGAESGVRAHASHLHGQARVVEAALDAIVRDHGVEASFDSYPYLRGSTIVAMLLLPSELQRGGVDATVMRLADPEVRRRMREEWFPANRRLPSITLSYLGSPEWAWAEGMTLAEAAECRGLDATDFVCEALTACDLAVGCVVDNGADRTEGDLRQLLRRHGQMAGSDAIFLGARPHPRGWGTFARLLARHVRDLGDWSWGDAAWHLSGNAAQRFGLVARGRVAPGAIADLAVIDPRSVADLSSYDEPIQPARGVSHVVVGGTRALDENGPRGVRSGRALRAWEDTQ